MRVKLRFFVNRPLHRCAFFSIVPGKVNQHNVLGILFGVVHRNSIASHILLIISGTTGCAGYGIILVRTFYFAVRFGENQKCGIRQNRNKQIGRS